MGLLDRFIKQEVIGESAKQIRMEEELEAEFIREQQMRDMMGGGMGGYSGGQPLPPSGPIALPPTIEHETMKIYLQPETPEGKEFLRGNDRYWIYDDKVCTSILTSNLTRSDQRRLEIILRQARGLEGCDNVENLILNLQYEAYMIIITNKARSDLPDHIRERIVPSIGMSLHGEALQGLRPERPKESRALFGVWGKRE